MGGFVAGKVLATRPKPTSLLTYPERPFYILKLWNRSWWNSTSTPNDYDWHKLQIDVVGEAINPYCFSCLLGELDYTCLPLACMY